VFSENEDIASSKLIGFAASPGIEDVMENIHSGDVIRIDGSMGTAEIINQLHNL
jgi:hypothetical protein